MYQSKIFANGSTTLPKPVREALGVEASGYFGEDDVYARGEGAKG
ncbi:type II toxin-antitoxin system PrlF family antitoxin [Planktomarina sp.]|nr:type II toxin-antitoxin system PrlF family antitoxin [Planktomarina sp.]